MVSIVSFHSNKHVNVAAHQFDAVGLIGYIEGSTVQKKLLSSAEYRIQNTEYERHSAAITIVQKKSSTVACMNRSPPPRPPSNPPSPPCRLTTSPICPAVPPPSPPYPFPPPYPSPPPYFPSSPPTPPPTSSPPPFAPAFPPANMLMILQGRMRII